MNIKTPNDLLDFMEHNIKYGYLGRNNKIYYHGDNDFDNDLVSNYVLESKEELLKNHCGNCFDQVEFERDWFINNGYEIKTIYEMVLLDYKNNYPVHSFLVYKDEDNSWCWFENADYNNRGIHKFNTFDELIKYQNEKYIELLKTFNISDLEIEKIIVTEFTKPISGIGFNEYINYCVDSKRISKVG